MKNIAFIGLGVMGYPMAGHLARHLAGHSAPKGHNPEQEPKQGFNVFVYNRTGSKAAAWAEQYKAFGGKACSSIAEAVSQADVVFSCVGNDEDLREVACRADGILPNMKHGMKNGLEKGAIFVDHTTTSAKMAEELARQAQAKGIHFVDAPVSGGQSGAENGCLTIMGGGEEPIWEQLARELFCAYAKTSVYMGPHGQGQRAKMVNQICISGVLRGLSEGLLLAQQAGLDIPKLFGCLKDGAAGSWQMANRAETMALEKFDFGFAIEWMAKDLSYALAEAQKSGLHLALAEESLQQYRSLISQGHSREDSSSIYRAVQKAAQKT